MKENVNSPSIKEFVNRKLHILPADRQKLNMMLLLRKGKMHAEELFLTLKISYPLEHSEDEGDWQVLNQDPCPQNCKDITTC